MEVTIREDSQIADDMVDVCIDGEVFQSYFERNYAELVRDKLAAKVANLTRCNRFFVYGSLKTGYRLNHILTDFGAVKVADARIEGYTLLDCNRQFPAMIEVECPRVAARVPCEACRYPPCEARDGDYDDYLELVHESKHVEGEVWEAPASPVRALALLDELDIIEGVPRLYKRVLVETSLQLQRNSAWAYLWNTDKRYLKPCGSIWPRANQAAT